MLSVEPWGMKRFLLALSSFGKEVSVLSVEPWGMKLAVNPFANFGYKVSVLSVEPWGMKREVQGALSKIDPWFQCSRSSRGG